MVSFKLQVMVFAVCSFEKAETRFQGQCRPAVDMVSAYSTRKIGYGVVNVFQHLGHDKLPGITWLVKVCIIGIQLYVIPRNIPETNDLLEIKVCTEETCHRSIVGNGLFVIAVVCIFDQSVGTPQIFPAPSAAGRRHGTAVASFHYFIEDQLDKDIALVIERLLVQKVVVERIGEHLQIALCLEVVI